MAENPSAPKPQSDYAWEEVLAPVKTIAHWVPASRQVMEDSPALQSIVDMELRYGLQDAEEMQLLLGDGADQNLLGIMQQATPFLAPFTIASPTMLDILLQALAQADASLLPADGIVLNTLDHRRMQAIKDTQGRYIGGGGMKFTPISLSPQDSQLLETRRWHVEEICRWFGVPPILIGHAGQGQTMWGTGVEQIALSWLALGLRAQLRRIEAAINLRLIEPADRATVYAEFAVEGLLRADSASRAALYGSFAQNGIMDRDEIREKENLPRRGGGAAKLTVQSNLLPIDDLGKVAVMPRENPIGPGTP